MRSPTLPLPETANDLAELLQLVAGNQRQVRPGSAYRLQFNRSFRFVDAIRLIPYLQRLGITTLYASPILAARAGSNHGYDITDHNHLNPEIGTEEEFHQMLGELQRGGMGLLLDVVPNHMGAGYEASGTNLWWRDVLENGRASEYANFFDIDWNPLKSELRNKVLLPILGNQYGEELEAGRIVLAYDGHGFHVEYFDKVLPIDPQTIPLIFHAVGEFSQPGDAARELLALLAALGELPPHTAPDSSRRQREIPYLLRRFTELVQRSDEAREYVLGAVRRLNGTPGDAHSFDALHQLLEAQVYRLAHWRVSAEEINYRRFFDVNDLIGLRMEDPAGLCRHAKADSPPPHRGCGDRTAHRPS